MIQGTRTHLLPQLHDLESLEVVQLPPLLELGALLGPRALRVLVINLVLFPLGLDESVTGSAREFRDDDRCEGKVAERGRLSWDGSLRRWSINEHLILCEQLRSSLNNTSAQDAYTLVVDDLDNGS